jgi:hypothetical protein
MNESFEPDWVNGAPVLGGIRMLLVMVNPAAHWTNHYLRVWGLVGSGSFANAPRARLGYCNSYLQYLASVLLLPLGSALADVLERIADHKSADLAALLPWNWSRVPGIGYAA